MADLAHAKIKMLSITTLLSAACWILLVTAQLMPAQAGTICPAGSPCVDDVDTYSANEVLRNQAEGTEGQICYADLGCFSTSTGELAFLETLPASPEQIAASFILYSDKLPNGLHLGYDDPTSFLRMDWRASHKGPEWLSFVVHGFASSSKTKWVNELKDAVLKDIGGFVIVVDWSRAAAFPDYIRAAANTQILGRMAARLTHRLVSRYPGVFSLNRTHWIGHSLGGQMAHFYSQYVQELGNDRPARITGLDVCAPEFEKHGIFVNKADADFVEGIHTSAGGSIISGELGMTTAFGHVDFYPNGGSMQPGCTPFSFGCSHSRSHDLYLEARRNSSCRFTSYSCIGGLRQYLQGKCVKLLNNSSELGLRANELPGRGSQFFETNSRSPYCAPRSPFAGLDY